MDTASIKKFAQVLVQIPSQGGIDSCHSIIDATYAFGCHLGLPFKKILDDNSVPVALVCEIKGKHPGKTWCLNACLDTAPIGAPELWKKTPFSGEIENEKLYGRGAADSKIAVAIFTHLAQELSAQQEKMHGNLVLIFDADEHTGNFGGIKAAMKAGYKPDGIMIGYPGDQKVVVGSRGFSRYEIVLTGKAGHSGASARVQDNPLVRQAAMVQALTENQPEPLQTKDFPKQPKLTVTQTQGGDGFSVIPSKAMVCVDVRLTPVFNEAAADKHIKEIVKAQDHLAGVPPERVTEIKKISSEPPYLTPENSELRTALRTAIQEITGKVIPEQISGPSNIGCFLAKQGMQVTAGYGVPAKGVHAPNEAADLRSLGTIYKVYETAFKQLLKL